MPLSFEIEMEYYCDCPDPSDFDWISTRDPDQGYVKVKFAIPTPSSIPKVKTYSSNESCKSDYYRFTQLVLILPPMEGIDLYFDLGIEYKDSGLSDIARYLIVLYADSALWCNLMIKKDL